MTLPEFLLARIAEDKERAAEWTYTEDVGAGRVRTVTVPVGVMSARVLAWCETVRRIVELHGPRECGPVLACSSCGGDGRLHGGTAVYYPCVTLEALTLPYAAHPDFDPAWAV